MPDLATMVAEAVNAIRGRWNQRPACGVVLGTGHGAMAERVRREIIIPYAEIPHFPQSTALAHAGRLVCGELCDRPVAVMQGRCHLYEGYSFEQVALPTLALCCLGVERMILTNAAGGVNPYYEMGDVMLIDSHINLLWGAPQSTAPAVAAPRTCAANPYCPELLRAAWQASRTADFEAHRGVYVAVTGPSYETRSEYRAFRQIGGDAVGMSTVPEVLAANRAGAAVVGVSVITNVARPDCPDSVDAEDVVAAAEAAAPHVRRVVEAALQA